MAKKGLAEEVFGLLAGRPDVKRIERSRSPCGGAKKRVKIVRAAAKLLLTITEPDYPSSSLEIETADVIGIAAFIERYARRAGAQVLNK